MAECFKNLVKKYSSPKRFFSLVVVNLFLWLGVISTAYWGPVPFVKRKEIKKEKERTPEIYQVSGASLSLQGPNSLTVGGSGTYSLILNTNGANVDGVDIIINFNHNLLRLDNIIPNNGCVTNVSALSCFKAFLPVVDDNGVFNQGRVKDCANTGNWSGQSCPIDKIEFGAVTFDYSANNGAGNITNPVNGSNIKIADLVFTALAPGTVNLNFDFTSGQTTDTNVVTHDNTNVIDILTSVSGKTVNITSGGSSPSPSVSPSPSPSRSPSPSPSRSPSPSPSRSPSPSPSPVGVSCNGCDFINNNFLDFNDLVYLLQNWSSISNNFDKLLYILNNWGAQCF